MNCAETICLEIHRGKGIVPLVGAGLSLPAGIPGTAEMVLYLQLCIAKALGITTEANNSRWHPRLENWPRTRGSWVQTARSGYQSLIDHAQVGVENPNATSSERRLIEVCRQAFGALTDWRLGLQFLARIRPPEGDPDEIVLGDVDEHIVDAFFNHIVSGKVPAMGHRMIAHFTHALRTRVVLTLNFDDLLEQAFREVHLDPAIFAVHHSAGLPPWSLLGAEHAIIKLHGGRYGLRANLTLDSDPTDREYRHFISYLIGGDWHYSESDEVPEAKNHLLVGGVSGGERRVTLLIQRALKQIENLQVFWCCYTAEDVKAVEKAFPRPDGNMKGSGVVVVKHSHLGLLFWEIYQRVTRCLPPGGLEFPTTWQVPIPPSLDDEEAGKLDTTFDKLNDKIDKWLESERSSSRRGFVVECGAKTLPAGARCGITGFGWRLFDRWKQRRRCVWLDIEDIADIADLKERLLQAVACQVGRDHQYPPLRPVAGPEDGGFWTELTEHLQTTGQQWIIFMNIRGSRGFSADPFRRLEFPELGCDEKDPEKWIEQRRKHWEKPFKEKELNDFLRSFVGKDLPQTKIVIFSREAQCKFNWKPERFAGPVDEEEKNWAKGRAHAAIEWMKSDQQEGKTTEMEVKRRARLLWALTLFQQVRHVSAFVTRAVIGDVVDDKQACGPTVKGWDAAWQWVEDALDGLVKEKILRRKPGGFLWMYWAVREHLRFLLTTQAPSADRSVLHLGMADWHMTFFHATGDPAAILHAVYHRCRIAQIEWPLPTDGSGVRARGALAEAYNHLERGRASILARSHPRDTIDGLNGFIDCLRRMIDLEEANQNRNLRLLLLLFVETQLYRIWYYRDMGDSEKVLEKLEELESFETKPANKSRWQIYEVAWPERAFWNKYYRKFEASLVYESLRLYRLAEEGFNSIALQDFGFPDLVKIPDGKVWRKLNLWVNDSLHDQCRFERRRMMVHILRRLMEIQLLNAEVEVALEPFSSDGKQQRRIKNFINRAEKYYRAAEWLPRFLIDGETSSLRVERSRLHALKAGILSLKGDHQGVYRQLNQACIPLAHLPESEESIGHAVVDLRRVACKFDQIRRKYRDRDSNGAHRCDSRNKAGDCAAVTALLGDVREILDGVERRMMRARKSLWWWLRLCRYQMLWWEYSARLRAWRGESDKNSSHRDAMDAAHLINNVARRVSFDVYEFSRIIAAGLELYAHREGEEGDLWSALEVGAGAMKQILRRRDDLAPRAAKVCQKPGSGDSNPSPVKLYTDKVLARFSELESDSGR